MAGTIRIGNTEVPVLYHAEIPGSVVTLPGFTVPLSPAQLFYGGAFSGSGYNTIRHGGRDFSTMFAGGRTGLHDDSEIVVGTPNRGSDAYVSTVDVVRTTEQGTTSLINTQNLTVSTLPPDSNTQYDRNCSLYAFSYAFPDETDPAYRVKGYLIGKAEHDVKTTTSQVVSDSYAASIFVNIPIPAINKSRNLELYYDEEDPSEDDPNDEGEPSDEDGGDGDHTPIYDPIPIPTKPTMGAANAGFLTMYKLGLSLINQFASDMFASTVWEAIKLFFSNPIEFMVGCMLLPFEPSTGSSYKPKFGLVSFEHAYPAVDDQYKDIDCGSVTISKYWGSCFDYEPYTKIQIWLPYIGYRDLPVDEIMDMTINVKYRCDCLTGDCVAFISTGVVGETGPQIPRVIAQFYGNCGVRVPFGSVSFDAAVAAGISLVGAAAGLGLAGAASGLAASGAASAGGAAEAATPSTAVNVLNGASRLTGPAVSEVTALKPNVQKGGAAGASTGYMSIQTPYLIRRIPRQNLPADYIKFRGYPSNISGTLSQFSGYAEVENIQLNNIPAMEGERAEIMEWLMGGVII